MINLIDLTREAAYANIRVSLLRIIARNDPGFISDWLGFNDAGGYCYMLCEFFSPEFIRQIRLEYGKVPYYADFLAEQYWEKL